MNPVKEINISVPAFIVLIPLFFVWHNFVALYPYWSPVNALAFLGWLFILLLVLFFLLLRFYKQNRPQLFFLTGMLQIILLFYGYFADALPRLIGKTFFSSSKFLVVLTLLVIISLVIFVKRSQVNFKRTSLYLNLLFTLLITYETTNFALSENKIVQPDVIIDYSGDQKPALSPPIMPDSSKPDIFYIVFDGYTSSFILKKVWGYDNSSLDSYLKAYGFYIADKSRSNYNYTPYSIASELNMHYLKKKAVQKRNDPVWTLRAIRACKENLLFNFLKEENYAIHLSTNFTNTGDSISVSPYFARLAKNHVLYQTYPGRIKRDWGWIFAEMLASMVHSNANEFIQNYNRSVALETDYQINQIKGLCNSNPQRRPVFSYTHFMLLHDPHVFDQDGRVKPVGQYLKDNTDTKKTYLDQVKYANKIIQDLVNTILQSNKKNTIIVLQGDHGSLYPDSNNEYYYFDNLNAIYFPGQKYSDAENQFSNINTFRLVLNRFFSQNLPLLENKSYNIIFKNE